MALELNEDGYSIAALLEAQKRSVESEKYAPAGTQIKNMLSQVDLAALGKSLDSKSPLAQKADNLNKALSGESKYKTIAVPSGYDPFEPGDATVVNSIGINPSYIDVETVVSHDDDVEILNPNSVLKNPEPIIIREESIQEEEDNKSGQGYQTYSTSSKGRIGRSQGVSTPLDIDSMLGFPEMSGLFADDDGKAIAEEAKTEVVEQVEITPEKVEEVFNVGTDIKVKSASEVFGNDVMDAEFENLANLIASTMNVVDDIRKLRGSSQLEPVAQG